jgi:hypothetical protein
MNAATLTYTTPRDRKISKNLLGRDYAELLLAARRVADRPGFRNVKLWSRDGRLLSRVRPRVSA